ncbi:MAG: DUF2339 domain-containing protein [Candidatus Kapaibacterium sp.]
MTNEQRIAELQRKIGVLSNQQDEFRNQLNDIRHELHVLLLNTESHANEESQPTAKQPVATEIPSPLPQPEPEGIQIPSTIIRVKKSDVNKKRPPINLEKFIGENLINKIGILILVIGVGIGAKYSIEHNLISPLTRIVLGYLVGIVVMALGIKLKPRYHNYSSVLVSGAMSIFYFITFAAYSFYGLLPQLAAFALMVLFTAFTVVAALQYNKQVIAHIGLVGAYAVPFLLSDGSGRVAIMFSYMAIINTGILILSFKRSWMPLFYTAFGLTWLIYLSWYTSLYQTDIHFTIALVFACVFFIIFYGTFLMYRLTSQVTQTTYDIGWLLANSFIFYGIGYNILDHHSTGKYLLGVFTVVNAIIHFTVTLIVLKRQLQSKELFYVMAGLVLVFLTLAIPVQLDGNWVTILWAGEAAVLFWVGRKQHVPMYELMAYPLAVLAFGSYIQDLELYSDHNPQFPETRITPLFNVLFLTSVIVTASFSFILYLLKKHTIEPQSEWHKKLLPVFSVLLPIGTVIVAYSSFQAEISCYCQQLYVSSEISKLYAYDNDYNSYSMLWQLCYTMIFISALVLVFRLHTRYYAVAISTIAVFLLALFAFSTVGLYEIGELRTSYIYKPYQEFYHYGMFNVVMRYITLMCSGVLLFTFYRFTKEELFAGRYTKLFDIVLGVYFWILLSNELLYWIDYLTFTEHPYKLGLSILWAAFATTLIFMGIRMRKKHIRLFAIVVLGVTLTKLFLYDITSMDTITKTVLFVSLGVLLLASSFLYNKFKSIIFDETL